MAEEAQATTVEVGPSAPADQTAAAAPAQPKRATKKAPATATAKGAAKGAKKGTPAAPAAPKQKAEPKPKRKTKPELYAELGDGWHWVGVKMNDERVTTGVTAVKVRYTFTGERQLPDGTTETREFTTKTAEAVLGIRASQFMRHLKTKEKVYRGQYERDHRQASLRAHEDEYVAAAQAAGIAQDAIDRVVAALQTDFKPRNLLRDFKAVMPDFAYDELPADELAKRDAFVNEKLDSWIVNRALPKGYLIDGPEVSDDGDEGDDEDGDGATNASTDAAASATA